jgi:integrase
VKLDVICVNAKTVFNQAVREDLIMFNPFDRLKGNAAEPDKDWKYISLDELEKLLDACPNWAWKMLIALCRLAGLRSGEALELCWSDVDWQNHRFTVIAEKTGKRRVVPIEPKLYQLLLDAFEQEQEGQQRVCPVSKHCLWRNFQSIRKRAELPRWKDAFKVMRRNCETDWAQRYPQYAVSAWLGHGIEVSAKHYLQVPEELYEKVAHKNVPQTATKTATKIGI